MGPLRISVAAAGMGFESSLCLEKRVNASLWCLLYELICFESHNSVIAVAKSSCSYIEEETPRVLDTLAWDLCLLLNSSTGNLISLSGSKF